MGSFAHAVDGAAHLIDLIWALWFGIGLVVGGLLLARDERRLYRTRPRPEEVKAHADGLVARHGCEAFRINGDAMVAARDAKQFDRYLFLKEVSGELVARWAMEPRLSLDPIEDWWRTGAVQDPPSHHALPCSIEGHQRSAECLISLRWSGGSTIRVAPPSSQPHR